jgi:RNA polymerase sigma-B factor
MSTARPAGSAPAKLLERKRAAAEDRRLLLRYHEQNDDRARAELVERLMPLVRGVARRYQRGTEPFEDLVQVASLALVKAIDRFDPARTTAFTSYAMPTMLGELKRHFRNFSWAVHVPRGLQERTVAVQATVSQLSEQLGRSPSPAEVGEAMDLDQEQVLEAFETALAYDALSLDAPPRDGEESDVSGYGDLIGEEDERYELIELGVSIAPAFRQLPERERRILRMRFEDDMTQSEIAAEVGVSQMHVSRLIRRSLRWLEQAADENPGLGGRWRRRSRAQREERREAGRSEDQRRSTL